MSDLTAKITVLGAGSYGSALAICLARNSHSTVLWGRDPQHVEKMQASHSNEKYLPGSQFPPSLTITNDLESAVKASENILVLYLVMLLAKCSVKSSPTYCLMRK